MNSQGNEFEQFEYIRQIGKGSYGEVSLGRHKRDRKQYVLKKINLKKASKKEQKSSEQEAKLLSKLKHPNIVSYKDSFEKDGYLYIAMQYCEGGDLYHRLKEQKSAALEERQVVEWFVQIAMALQYMHERNILHRDLKTQNIFLTKSKIIKVGDLGIARVLESSTDMATTLIGTPYYMSPELFSNKPYNHKSDVWALGCCVYEMTTLKHAFNAKDMNSLVYKILKGKMPAMPKLYSSELVQLIKWMLHQDPQKRPSVNKLLRDPYIKQNIAIFLEETKQNRRPSSAARSRPSSNTRPSSSSVQRQPAPSKAAPDVVIYSRNSEEKSVPVVRNKISQPQKLPVNGQKKITKEEPENKKDDVLEVPVESSDFDTPDSVVPVTVKNKLDRKEAQVSPKKKKSVLHKIASNAAAVPEPVVIGSSDADSSSQKSKDIFIKPTPLVKPRPLPVPPTVTNSAGLPQRRKEVSSEGSNSSSASSKEENIPLGDETPRSLPNFTARERRRKEKGPTASSLDNPQSARLRLRPHSPEPVKAVKSKSVPQKSRSSVARGMKQPSMADSSSSEEERTKDSDDVKLEKERKRENKEMNNFISILDTTLNMNKVDEKSDEEGPGPPPIIEVEFEESTEEEIQQKVSSLPSVETLCSSDRLQNRIRLLFTDCVKGVGHKVLLKACELLEQIEEEDIELQLVELLGKEKFDEYAGKIWQLKFCEDQHKLMSH